MEREEERCRAERERRSKVVDNVSICERVSHPRKISSKPGSQSDSSFGNPVCPVGNAKTPIAIVIVDSRCPKE